MSFYASGPYEVQSNVEFNSTEEVLDTFYPKKIFKGTFNFSKSRNTIEKVVYGGIILDKVKDSNNATRVQEMSPELKKEILESAKNLLNTIQQNNIQLENPFINLTFSENLLLIYFIVILVIIFIPIVIKTIKNTLYFSKRRFFEFREYFKNKYILLRKNGLRELATRENFIFLSFVLLAIYHRELLARLYFYILSRFDLVKLFSKEEVMDNLTKTLKLAIMTIERKQKYCANEVAKLNEELASVSGTAHELADRLKILISYLRAKGLSVPSPRVPKPKT